MTKKDKIDLIFELVCKRYNVEEEEIMSRKRSHRIAIPRQIISILIYECTILSFPDVGKIMELDHTTIMHSMNKYRNNIGDKPSLKFKEEHYKFINDTLSFFKGQEKNEALKARLDAQTFNRNLEDREKTIIELATNKSFNSIQIAKCLSIPTWVVENVKTELKIKQHGINKQNHISIPNYKNSTMERVNIV